MRWVAALALLAGAAAAGDLPDPAAQGRALAVALVPVQVPADSLAPGVRVAGAWDLEGTDPDFGGLSGMVLGEGRAVFVTDRAHWVSARFDPEAEPPLSDFRIAPMRDADGARLTDLDTDSEGLALAGGTLHVAFEHAHRIARLEAGRLTGAVTPAGLAQVTPNGGMEAVAALPDGRLLILSEDRVEGAFLAWIGPPGGPFEAGRLPVRSHHAVTGAEVGPDGRLHVVQRFWSRETGVSIRVLAYALGPDGRPDPATATELAGFEAASGIDNMEAIDVTRRADGGLSVWIVADDNFRGAQRSLLVRLDL